MIQKHICVAFTEKLPSPPNINTFHNFNDKTQIRVPSVNVYIILGDEKSAWSLGLAEKFYLILGKVWILRNLHSSQWRELISAVAEKPHLFQEMLLFSSKVKQIPGFKQFINTIEPSQYPEDFYLHELWISSLNCSRDGLLCGKIKDCPPNSSLEFMLFEVDTITMSDFSVLTYDAVYMVAQILDIMFFQEIEMITAEDAKDPMLLSRQLHLFLREIHLMDTEYNLYLDERNMAQYCIYNFARFSDNNLTHLLPVKVGDFVYRSTHDQHLVINEEMIKWPASFKETPKSVCSQSCGPGFQKILQKGRPICCFLCVPCKEQDISNQTDAEQCIHCQPQQYPNLIPRQPQQYPNRERTHCLPKSVTFLAFADYLGMSMVCMALCFSVVTAAVLGVFVKHRHTPIVKANNQALSFILLISLLLCFLCPLLYISHPNTVTCILQQVTFGLVFTVAVSTILAKTITVILAFKAMKPGRTMRHLLLSGASNSVIPICSLIQMIICGVWLVISPPFIDIDSHSEPRHIIIMCNKGSVTAFYCVLGYLGFLALGTFTVAFLARNLPDTFNEKLLNLK
ncbi:vomeronasal type-2 receptor 116-like [Tupaia chinensis]|uniref:vomeronasal type-2 receptor 116-like n=1 Tax=Tupaia chinensis TaxID=246437 RepID=UPI0007044662|nr:vomeronasal type-2 receptor 116-like [Tupaia chinensis]